MAVKRSIVLIDPPFQLRLSVFVCIIVFLSSIIYPISIYLLIERVIEHVGIAGGKDWASLKTQLLVALGVYQFAFIGIVFVVCIFQTHKIAGPIFKLKKFLNKIQNGGNLEKLYFRKGDNFIELAEEVNETFLKIKETHNGDFAYLSEVNSYLNNLALVIPDDKKAVLLEITNKLTQIQERFKS